MNIINMETNQKLKHLPNLSLTKKLLEIEKLKKENLINDIRIFLGPKTESKIEIDTVNNIKIYNIYYNTSDECKKAQAFVDEHIMENFSAFEILKEIVMQDFSKDNVVDNKTKNTNKKNEYKMHKIFRSYYFNYTR